ncbi:hypothetical protein SDC9_140233 [bioreactor metagenome]|uniref:Uncharacterized protein n=1 Tax=bioreactor metagenome TaxID=1076179 RepID=A0A645DUN7_9ZZZZ
MGHNAQHQQQHAQCFALQMVKPQCGKVSDKGQTRQHRQSLWVGSATADGGKVVKEVAAQKQPAVLRALWHGVIQQKTHREKQQKGKRGKTHAFLQLRPKPAPNRRGGGGRCKNFLP